MKNSKHIHYLAQAGVMGALYVLLTYVSSLWGLAYGEIQFRISEALMGLALFTPAAIPGMTIGCVIANLGSPMGLIDIVLGSLATLLSVVAIYLTRHVRPKNIPFLMPLFPTLFNAVIVGWEISFFMPEGFTFAAFLASFVSVGLGELAVLVILGLPLYYVLQKTGLFADY